MKEVRERPKCDGEMGVKGGRKAEMKAVAKSLLTSRIERTYFCPRCRYKRSQITLILE